MLSFIKIMKQWIYFQIDLLYYFYFNAKKIGLKTIIRKKKNKETLFET